MILLDFSVFLTVTSVRQAQEVKTAYFFAGSVFAGSVAVMVSGHKVPPCRTMPVGSGDAQLSASICARKR
jgi:hypothetical protein